MERNTVSVGSQDDWNKNELISDPGLKTRVEARNGLEQFRAAMDMVDAATASGKFNLTPEIVLEINRLATQDLRKDAGKFRQYDVSITNTVHQLPTFAEVPALVAEMCDYVNAHWNMSAIHLAAYLIWRVNWIHPFGDGNGRSARMLSYTVLCIRLGFRLPGSPTIAQQIVNNKKPYYEALREADDPWKEGRVDVKGMEELLEGLLAEQLLSVYRAAGQKNN